MRLLLISTSYPARVADGSEAAGAFVADIAEALSQVSAVTVLAPGKTPNREVINPNLTVVRFPAPRLPLSQLNLLNPLDAYAILRTLKAGRRAVEKIARQEKISHILALWALPSGYWARQIGQQHGIPYSTWALGSDIWTLGRIPVIRSMLSRVLQDAHQRFADGYQLCNDVMRISRRPCEFLPSTRRFPAADRQLKTAPPYRLVFLGRWHRNKGADILLESLELLQPEDWARITDIRIYGGGPLESVVKTRGAVLRAAGHPVTVGGYLDTQAAAKLLQEADYLLLPSRIESIPVIFSDAMKSGCPVIAMPVGDLPRLLQDYSTGILSAGRDADNFSRTIRQALARTPSEFVHGLRAATEVFDVDQIARRLRQKIAALP